MTPFKQYIAEEIATDHADGLFGRREALRRLGLLGLTAASASALLAACGQTPAAQPTSAPAAPAGEPTAAPAGAPAGEGIEVAVVVKADTTTWNDAARCTTMARSIMRRMHTAK